QEMVEGQVAAEIILDQEPIQGDLDCHAAGILSNIRSPVNDPRLGNARLMNMHGIDAPRRVGRWILKDPLGTGGNATVWRATHEETGQFVALKVIHSSRAAKEPYQRFIREIRTLQALGNRRGILPLLDAYLPEQPSSDNRPWLAMPIANGIARALAGAPLEQ